MQKLLIFSVDTYVCLTSTFFCSLPAFLIPKHSRVLLFVLSNIKPGREMFYKRNIFRKNLLYIVTFWPNFPCLPTPFWGAMSGCKEHVLKGFNFQVVTQSDLNLFLKSLKFN